MGKAADRDTKPIKETRTGHVGPEEPMQTSLLGIAQRAKREKSHRFENLYGLLNEEYLLKCWRGVNKKAAMGVDQQSAEEYERDLVNNIRDLVSRLKRKEYRAKLIRRKYIVKENGKQRPLGIPVVEDKLLQLAASRILEAIYDQDFLELSYGYRRNRGANDASEEVTRKLQFGTSRYVVEADIQGYFDNIDHDWMERMLKQRVNDGPFLRLIRKWLKAGVLETDSTVLHPETGTPQGGVISPVLGNIYLHYALDVWFEWRYKQSCGGEAFLIRYADDFICGFGREQDANRFRKDLEERMKKFGLKLSPDKTRVLRFSRWPESNASFDFLGYEYRWGKDRKGNARIKRRTSRKKLRSALKRVKTWLRENQSLKLSVMYKQLNAKLRGYYTHYGVIGNWDSLNQFYRGMERHLFKRLNRRSQKWNITWKRFNELKDKYGLLKPKLLAKQRWTHPVLDF